MLFSERSGLTRGRTVAQLDDMDIALRNGLWNAVAAFYWDTASFEGPYGFVRNSDRKELFIALWDAFLKRPVDEMPHHFDRAVREVRDMFFECEWYRVYDFLEFLADRGPDRLKIPFRQACNKVLQRELSGYR